ncbi:hypothetical protein BH18THE2_BH18THE2_41760 [soil metagenome]
MPRMKNIIDWNIFPLNTKKSTILSVILIIAVSYGLFFYLQNNTERDIRNSLFEQQKERQIESTEALSRHIGSDLDSIMSKLQVLANSATLQEGGLSGDNTAKLLEEIYRQTNSITPVDRLFILDRNNTVTANIVPKGERTFVGTNVSDLDWVKEADKTKPFFSNGYVGLDGKYRLAITYPIVNNNNNNTGQYLGLVGAVISTIQFFEHYGNIYDTKSQYLAVLDRNAVQLIHPVKSFIGTSFFGNHTQQATGHNEVLNHLIRTVISGEPYFDIYEFRNGERLNTGSPIFVAGKPVYSIFVITPTSAIYSQINDVISTQKIETFSLLAGVTAAVAVLIIFLIKWNTTLNNEVKRRTREMDESNKQLSEANERLKVHDKMQKEFINIASHEMKTPTQAILGFSELLQQCPEKRDEMIQAIQRNAGRLQRLTSEILDVTRIESRSLKLEKEKINLNDVVINCINDVTLNKFFSKGEKNVKISYAPTDIFIEADRIRLTQVISNLLSNAVKFTKEGIISITSEKNDSQVIVTIKDTGAGIEPDLFPRLFSKFATRSASGTGLGLFISKSIVEAHGGKIWAENNPNGRGAIFTFSLPG